MRKLIKRLFTFVDHPWTVVKGAATSYVVLAMNTIIAYPLVFIAVLPFAPLYIQLPSAVIFALVASSPVWYSRAIAQPKLAEKIEKVEAKDKPDVVVSSAD